jgi:hypothetical protein
MSKDLVSYEAYDLLQQRIPDAFCEVSTDGGKTFRNLTGQERTDGFLVSESQRFVARISKPGLWPVVQPLVIADEGYLTFDGARDFGAAPLFSHSAGQPGEWRHIFHGSLTLLRDGAPDRKANGCPDVPPFMYDTLKFGGPPVFSTSGTGFGRLAASVQQNVPSFSTNKGLLLFAKSVPNAILNMPGEAVRIPELTALYVPPGLDITGPISMHIFFSPITATKKGNYPYGSGRDSFSEMTDNYLVSAKKRFLNQCNASGKNVVFVFPLAPGEVQFRGISPASRMRRFLIEVAYVLRRILGGSRFPFLPEQLGMCSASCFSAGASSLLPLLRSSVDENAFPEFKEAYSLDGYPGKPTEQWIAMSEQMTAWWKGGSTGRRIRMYAHFDKYLDPAMRPMFARQSTTTVTLPGGVAFATELPTATFAYTSQRFWEQLVSETTDSPGYFERDPASGRPWLYPPQLDGEKKDGVLHQLIPAIFLQHALATSSHPDAAT